MKLEYKVVQIDDVLKMGFGKVFSGDALSFNVEKINNPNSAVSGSAVPSYMA